MKPTEHYSVDPFLNFLLSPFTFFVLFFNGTLLLNVTLQIKKDVTSGTA